MPYATQADLCPEVLAMRTLVELTDDERTGAVVPAVVASKLNEASGIIEVYCRERYSLPLAQTAELTALCCAITAYKLYGRRSGEPPVTIVQNYKDAIQLLKDIAGKKASLDQPTTPNVQQSPSTQIAVSRKKGPFSGSNMEGYF